MSRDIARIPVARTTDPATSHRAEQRVTDSGRRQSQAERLYAAIVAHPGQCRGQLAAAVDMEEYQASKRLSDLRNAGRIVQGPPREWHGNHQSTWWPSELKGQMPLWPSNT